MKKQKDINILIVDDSPTVVELIKCAVKLGGYTISVAYDGEQGLEKILTVQPDCAIIDVNMPKMDGYQLVRHLRGDPQTADLPLIILSGRTSKEDQIQGLLTGCDVYFTKPTRPEVLHAQIEALLRRKKLAVSTGVEILHFSDIEIDIQAHTATRDGDKLELTAKEFALLECFLRHPHQVLTRNVLLDHVWGGNFDWTSNIVDVYVKYLRKKLESGGRARLIHTIRGIGYVLKEADTQR